MIIWNLFESFMRFKVRGYEGKLSWAGSQNACAVEMTVTEEKNRKKNIEKKCALLEGVLDLWVDRRIFAIFAINIRHKSWQF